MATSLEKFIGKSLDNATSIGWFGFSADPPTLSHRAIIDAVLGSGLVQKIIVFPAGKLPYKDFQASDWQRTEMVELWRSAAEFGEEVIISRFDLLRESAISWYELWCTIRERSPKLRHFLILGSDQYAEIPRTWNKGKKLLKEASFIIVPREGFEGKVSHSHHFLLNIAPLQGSSTDVRKGNLDSVDEKVKASILEQGLYRS